MNFVPKVGPDGLRRYNKWAGNPKGDKEDATRCVASVTEPGRGIMSYQCQRKRGHGPDRLYCKQHDPAAQAERARKSHENYRREIANSPWAKLESSRKVIAALVEACEAALPWVDKCWHDYGQPSACPASDKLRAALALANGDK